MKVIGSIQPSFERASAPAARSVKAQTQDNVASNRALVALAPVMAPYREAPAAYRPANFLAQLIATQGQHPQTRERRRAEPGEATQTYETAMANKSIANGRLVSRAM